MTEKPEHLTQEVEEANESKEPKEPYKARNKVVEGKERLYDRMNLSVRQVDIFIGVCVIVMLLLVFGGKFLF